MSTSYYSKPNRDVFYDEPITYCWDVGYEAENVSATCFSFSADKETSAEEVLNRVLISDMFFDIYGFLRRDGYNTATTKTLATLVEDNNAKAVVDVGNEKIIIRIDKRDPWWFLYS